MEQAIELRLIRALRSLRRSGPASETPLDREGISAAQYAAMEALAERPGCGLQELASAQELSLPTVSVCIRKLEAAGMVRRVRREGDARSVRLYLTEKGLHLLDEALAFRLGKAADLLGMLSPGEGADLVRLLEKALKLPRSGSR